MYTAPLSPETTLEDIFVRFNNDRPEDFKGHSLSASEILLCCTETERIQHIMLTVQAFCSREATQQMPV
ncbi:MAG: YodL domain-containing protein [Clostridiales bacterium]|nr:YodL domain-containing protein [Clostridiales bacterium]